MVKCNFTSKWTSILYHRKDYLAGAVLYIEELHREIISSVSSFGIRIFLSSWFLHKNIRNSMTNIYVKKLRRNVYKKCKSSSQSNSERKI